MVEQTHSDGVLAGDHFFNGDIACAEGAIAAGCRFFAGYPITPASEIAERISARFPEVDGQYIQMEDELASIAAVVGASNAGKKAMTATSGPGMSLMLENLGLAAITETPCVVVNVQRGGPSTGMPTLPAQADVMQARYGSHGDYPIVAYAPLSPQEMFEYTVRAFNTAETYRSPVLILADQAVGHMTGKVSISDDIDVASRPSPDATADANSYLPFDSDHLIAPMAAAGDGLRVHVTGLTHDERGYPSIDPDTQEAMLGRMMEKISAHREEICQVDRYQLDDATVAIVAYGSTARSAREAVVRLRKNEIAAGLLRIQTPWPFPLSVIQELSEAVDHIVVAEMNLGQYVHRVRAEATCPVSAHPHHGGAIPHPAEIAQTVMEAIK